MSVILCSPMISFILWSSDHFSIHNGEAWVALADVSTIDGILDLSHEGSSKDYREYFGSLVVFSTPKNKEEIVDNNQDHQNNAGIIKKEKVTRWEDLANDRPIIWPY